MQVSRPLSVALVSLIVFATAALAGGVLALLESALVLEGEYDTLAVQIGGCPSGTCQEADDLVDELDRLNVELTQLHTDAATCGCTNTTLESKLDDLDVTAAQLYVTVSSW